MQHFSDYQDFIEHLESLGLFSMQLGLARMRSALQRLKVTPDCPVVRLVGTNGKGSTAGFVEALAARAGLRAGLYTSPHLLSVRERIRIAGEFCSEACWLRAANQVLRVCADLELTYFELLTVMALVIFAEERVDLVILEAGLGGTHDATCVIQPDLALVTSIGLDHEQVLGPTLLHIAKDKAGSLGLSPGLSAWQHGGVAAVLSEASGAWPFEMLPQPADQCLVFQDFSLHAEDLRPHPFYQLENAALALRAWQQLALRYGWNFSVQEGLAALRMRRFPGRFCSHGPVLVDGAHNTPGILALCASFEKEALHFDALIFQRMNDKHIADSALKRLETFVDAVYIPSLENIERGAAPQDVSREFSKPVTLYSSLKDALYEEQRILICGSLYLAGEYYKLYPEKFLQISGKEI